MRRSTSHFPRLRSRRRSSKGAVTLESILALPVLVIVVLAAYQFGMSVLVQETISHAAIHAAREAAKEANLANPNEVNDANAAAIDAANEVLGVLCLAIDPNSADTTSDTKLILEFGTLAPIKTGDPGLDCDPPAVPMVAADEVRVTICAELTAHPICNLLKAFDPNLDFAGRHLQASSLVKKE